MTETPNDVPLDPNSGCRFHRRCCHQLTLTPGPDGVLIFAVAGVLTVAAVDATAAVAVHDYDRLVDDF